MQAWAKWILGITATLVGVGVVGGVVAIASHGERIVAVETRQESQGDLLKETRDDAKAIRSTVDRMAGSMGVKDSRAVD